MVKFTRVQEIRTSGARAVEPFMFDGAQYLAIAQMAVDIAGRPPHINGGSSRTTMPILRLQGGQFAPHSELPVEAGEDAEFFRIGDRAFLATASLRSGDGPYDMNTHSVVYEWRGDGFVPFQTFPTFAAKQWRHFTIDGQHFLALAQGVTLPGIEARHPSQSAVFLWDGKRFSELQTVASGWGYNWRHIHVGGRHLLAYSDNATPSVLLEWTGTEFRPFQILDGKSGRAVCCFEQDGETWLAVANLLEESFLMQWTSKRFERRMTLCGAGAREFLWLPNGGGHLVQANFMLGSREEPRLMSESVVYAFRGGNPERIVSLPTSGAVDVAFYEVDGHTHVAVANSLSAGLRFDTHSAIFQVEE